MCTSSLQETASQFLTWSMGPEGKDHQHGKKRRRRLAQLVRLSRALQHRLQASLERAPAVRTTATLYACVKQGRLCVVCCRQCVVMQKEARNSEASNSAWSCFHARSWMPTVPMSLFVLMRVPAVSTRTCTSARAMSRHWPNIQHVPAMKGFENSLRCKTNSIGTASLL